MSLWKLCQSGARFYIRSFQRSSNSLLGSEDATVRVCAMKESPNYKSCRLHVQKFHSFLIGAINVCQRLSGAIRALL